MNKLNKPRAFEASPNSIKVMFGTQEVECTTLMRSGITVQTVILVAHEGKWHEIEIADLGLDTVYLPTFKHHVESNCLKLSDLGLEPEKVDYELKHIDFEELQSKYSKYDYVQISKLHEYQKKYGIPNSKKDLEKTLEMVSQNYLSIGAYIDSLEKLKDSIIKRPDSTYEEVANTDKPAISNTDGSVSLQIFEKLTPEKITELQELRITQEEIVKANPVVIITDKKTYAEAKKTAAVLLSASTAIDGSKGVEATATKYLNTFKTMLKTALAPISKLTREPYNEQKKLIEDWDNRILLQTQNRIKELCAVPFVFDGVNYTIGILTVTPLEIENLNDVMFADIVEKGKNIQIALESAKLEQNKEIEDLKEANRLLTEKLEVFMKLQGMNNTELVIENPESGATESYKAEFVQESNIFAPAEEMEKKIIEKHGVSSIFLATEPQTSEEATKLPNPNNKLLNKLYLDHLEVVEEKRFRECAVYYAQALSDAGDVINDILVNPDKTVQKSVAIDELINTWKL